jgi:hypothetical protein
MKLRKPRAVMPPPIHFEATEPPGPIKLLVRVRALVLGSSRERDHRLLPPRKVGP